jgi:hypothetical protein
MVAGLTTRIGPFPSGTRVGFFMRQDGYLDASNYRLNNTIWWSINSTNLVNLDGFRHTSIVSIDGKIIVGFEDFTGMGDQDYNDGKGTKKYLRKKLIVLYFSSSFLCHC